MKEKKESKRNSVKQGLYGENNMKMSESKKKIIERINPEVLKELTPKKNTDRKQYNKRDFELKDNVIVKLNLLKRKTWGL